MSDQPLPSPAEQDSVAQDSIAPNVRAFRCDDHAGFELRVLRAADSDFYVFVVPRDEDFTGEACNPGPEELDHFAPCYRAGVRIRVPMIGGGAHDQLWHALAGLFAEPPARPTRTRARRAPATRPPAGDA